jgi:hypothetical protein
MSHDDIDIVLKARQQPYYLKCKVIIVNKTVDQMRAKLNFETERQNIEQVFLIPEHSSNQQGFIAAWIKPTELGADYDMIEPCEVIVSCAHPIHKTVRMLASKPNADCFDYHLKLMTVASKEGSDELDILNVFKVRNKTFIEMTVRSQDDEDSKFCNV